MQKIHHVPLLIAAIAGVFLAAGCAGWKTPGSATVAEHFSSQTTATIRIVVISTLRLPVALDCLPTNTIGDIKRRFLLLLQHQHIHLQQQDHDSTTSIIIMVLHGRTKGQLWDGMTLQESNLDDRATIHIVSTDGLLSCDKKNMTTWIQMWQSLEQIRSRFEAVDDYRCKQQWNMRDWLGASGIPSIMIRPTIGVGMFHRTSGPEAKGMNRTTIGVECDIIKQEFTTSVALGVTTYSDLRDSLKQRWKDSLQEMGIFQHAVEFGLETSRFGILDGTDEELESKVVELEHLFIPTEKKKIATIMEQQSCSSNSSVVGEAPTVYVRMVGLCVDVVSV